MPPGQSSGRDLWENQLKCQELWYLQWEKGALKTITIPNSCSVMRWECSLWVFCPGKLLGGTAGYGCHLTTQQKAQDSMIQWYFIAKLNLLEKGNYEVTHYIRFGGEGRLNPVLNYNMRALHFTTERVRVFQVYVSISAELQFMKIYILLYDVIEYWWQRVKSIVRALVRHPIIYINRGYNWDYNRVL